MASKQEIFEKTLTNAFRKDSFVDFIREMVSGVKIVAPDKELKTYNTFAVFVSKYLHVGEYEDPDGDRIGIFAVELKRGESIERARSAQRSFVKTLLERGGYAGALVAFYAEGMNVMLTGTWRFSFIRMDYEFAKGKIKETLTPAKRYSYLVGKGEPCHTAMDRLFPIFVDDEYPPTLDELEEAFSVESVTNEFFAKYKEKYLEMQEFLEKNEDFKRESEYRGFTSEQFTKKLLSQIVFLYFVQKKGWLGVNAIPPMLTEKEYKNAFYAKGFGQKPKEIIPLVYQEQNGNYLRNGKGLLSLSEQDELILSKIVKGQRWGTGPKNFMRNIFNDCVKREKNFFDDYLEPLFYTGLNQNRGDDAYFQPLHCRIPFLNGGLFEELDNYDWQNNDFQIPNEMFSNMDTMGREADGVLDIFDRYNFTMAEDEPMEREVAVDPEMLGKVFENLLEVRDRKSKGAFYTPREIVHYMCQESLINYLVTRSGIAEDDIRKLVLYGEYFKEKDAEKTLKVPNKNGNGFHMELDKKKDFEIPASIFSYKDGTNRLKEIDDLLANVKVVDPAVGSGAFPLGMLNEIVKARDTLSTYMTLEMNAFDKKAMFAPGFVGSRSFYDLKAETIKNCIFACDIEPSATDIAKLRLWLSLVIDDELSDDAMNDGMFGEHSKPKQLPNLDCNIICGNSLDDTFGGVDFIKESDLLNNIAGEHQENMMQSGVDAMISTLIDLQDKLYYTKGSHEKAEIKEKIQDIYDAIIEEQLRINPNLLQAYRDSVHEASRPFVLWQLYFPRVFKENGGFDICIGNPPYIQLQKAIDDDGTKLGDLYKHLGFTTFVKTGDIYCLFYEKGCGLLKYGGVLSFITSNKWMKSSYGKSLRAYFAKEMRILTLIDLGGGVFETATVDTNILIAEAKPQKQPYLYNALKLNKTQRVDRLRLKDFSEYEMSKEAKPIALVDNALKPIVEKINKNGTLLGEWEIIINRGLVTGLNEAFIIDQEKRDEIIRLEPHAEGIIFPIYRGKDVSRYNSEFHNLYLIYIPWHFPLNEDNITGASEVAEKAFKEQYPVLYAHLLAYKGKLENRNKEETGIRYEWYALQRFGSNYWKEYFKEKIAYRQISLEMDACLLDGKSLVNDKCYFVTGDHLIYLLCVFNSTVFNKIILQSANTTGNKGASFMSGVRVPIPNATTEKTVESLYEEMCAARSANNKKIEQEQDQKIDELISKLYGLTDEEIEVLNSIEA